HCVRYRVNRSTMVFFRGIALALPLMLVAGWSGTWAKRNKGTKLPIGIPVTDDYFMACAGFACPDFS
ncbi:MAG: hypothetical protein QGF59_12005, partial [Pirellulaceae bacterium]|nr:hypothetical protein [Pirellulaceae bacterium]